MIWLWEIPVFLRKDTPLITNEFPFYQAAKQTYLDMYVMLDIFTQ